MVTCILKESELEKIAYFQNFIKNKLYNSNHHKLRLQLMDQENVVPCLGFNTKQHISLMEFTVKHTITLDSESKEIRTKKLSKEDIDFTVQSELFDFSSKTHFPEFSKLLTPDLPWASPGFFKKYGFKNQIYDLILENYRDFILILLNIISKLIFSPLALSPPAESYESQNNFAFRMRP
ncbi:hypothetical protein [Rickettsiella endosymbiont of Rhagonycha lignosa]|uniref:hypothetical protein n=1 Tax=Rickettsiella endosymbiont of Rhagonycha lignosa TaxID=3077937 RepID=UPI00313D9400